MNSFHCEIKCVSSEISVPNNSVVLMCKESPYGFIDLWGSEYISGISSFLGLCSRNQWRLHDLAGSFGHQASGHCPEVRQACVQIVAPLPK